MTTGWQRHDLRRTGATMLGMMEVLPAIVEAALNHKTIHSALKENYNTARYAGAVGEALQLLADKQDEIVAIAKADAAEADAEDIEARAA